MKLKLTAKVLLLLMIVALFATTGCDKKIDEPTNTDLLVKEWKFISVGREQLNELVVLLKFESDGKGTYSWPVEGEIATIAIKWSWGTNEETLNMNLGFGGDVVWTIEKLTADELWYYDDSNSLFKLVPNK